MERIRKYNCSINICSRYAVFSYQNIETNQIIIFYENSNIFFDKDIINLIFKYFEQHFILPEDIENFVLSTTGIIDHDNGIMRYSWHFNSVVKEYFNNYNFKEKIKEKIKNSKVFYFNDTSALAPSCLINFNVINLPALVIEIGNPGVGTSSINFDSSTDKYVIYPLEWWDSFEITKDQTDESKFKEEIQIGILKILKRYHKIFQMHPKIILMSGYGVANFKTFTLKEISIPILLITGVKNQYELKFAGLINYIKNKEKFVFNDQHITDK